MALALQGSNPKIQVRNLAAVAVSLVKLQEGEQARKVVEQAERVVATVRDPSRAPT